MYNIFAWADLHRTTAHVAYVIDGRLQRLVVLSDNVSAGLAYSYGDCRPCQEVVFRVRSRFVARISRRQERNKNKR